MLTPFLILALGKLFIDEYKEDKYFFVPKNVQIMWKRFVRAFLGALNIMFGKQ